MVFFFRPGFLAASAMLQRSLSIIIGNVILGLPEKPAILGPILCVYEDRHYGWSLGSGFQEATLIVCGEMLQVAVAQPL